MAKERTAAAVRMLRNSLSLSQAAFAEKLKTTVTTISRWENGRMPPSEETLQKLAAAAAESGSADLRDYFDSQRKVSVHGRVGGLPSSGTKRRVSLDDLKYWSARLRETVRTVEGARSADPAALREHLRNSAWVMEHVSAEIEVLVSEAHSPEEDRELLKRHAWKLAADPHQPVHSFKTGRQAPPSTKDKKVGK
jgi:transcriptional regulator with XRE-family HTH domain